MMKLIHANILKIPLIHFIDTSKLMPKSFNQSAFCQYHNQLSHDTQKCSTLKNSIQDLIDFNATFVDVEVNSMNKSITFPN